MSPKKKDIEAAVAAQPASTKHVNNTIEVIGDSDNEVQHYYISGSAISRLAAAQVETISSPNLQFRLGLRPF